MKNINIFQTPWKTRVRSWLGGGATGAIAPRLPLEGGPRDNLFFQIKYSFEKSVIQKRYKDTTLYYIAMLR